MSLPNEHREAFAGVKDTKYTMEVSEQYATNLLTFTGPNSGLMTIRAKVRDNTSFEQVVNGTLDLTKEKTLRISGYQIQEFELSVSETVPFAAIIVQSDPILVSARK